MTMQGSDPRETSHRRIAVLLHESDRHYDTKRYVIGHLARFWREDGHEVVLLYGTDEYVPADILVVHVDLSVVPKPYLRFAMRYPRVINGGIADIRKSVISRNLLGPEDPWPGPVIVKSNLNCAGVTERKSQAHGLSHRSKLWSKALTRCARILGTPPPFRTWKDYRIYDRMVDVPRRHFADHRVVVERFLPELENGLYRLRVYQFLGDKHQCTRLAGPDPVLKSYSSVRAEKVEPAPETVNWRRQFNIDYGHFDYVIHNGEAVLLDVNKTTGASTHLGNEELEAGRRILARGIYAFF